MKIYKREGEATFYFIIYLNLLFKSKNF